MTVLLALLIAVLAGAMALATWAAEADRRRVHLMGRAAAGSEAPIFALPPRRERALLRALTWLGSAVPEIIRADGSAERLVRAGFQSPAAPAAYAVIRLVSVVAIPLAVVSLGIRGSMTTLLTIVGAGIGIGLLLPRGVVTALTQRRAHAIRRSLPDALDLLLVCVEAGVSVDAAILRVGRELQAVHPELAHELLVVNRKTNAGVRREDALRALYDRTGVEELRALASTLIQSERWGTSIGRVLRVYSESLRRKRRQSAEKRAAVAASRMVFPLALLILPALFIVLGGSVVLGLGPLFEAFTNR